MLEQFTPDEVARLKLLIAPKVQTTHIIQVLDKSSSMEHGKSITISSYNEMLDVAKKSEQPAGSVTTATLITFSDRVQVDYEHVSLDKVPALTETNYVPSGMTALYDAIGLAIETASRFKKDDNTAFLLQIFTDGGENASKTFTMQRLKSMIEEVNSTGKWTVTVAGPQGAIDIFAQAISIAKGNVAGFNPNSLHSRVANASNMVNSTGHYFMARAAGASAVQDAYSSVIQPTEGEGTGLFVDPTHVAKATVTTSSEVLPKP